MTQRVTIAVLLWVSMVAPVMASELHYIRDIWLDETRQRHVNIRLSFPEPRQASPVAQALPVFLFSLPQGWRWGGYQDHYVYLAAEMARRGVAMATISHYDAMETQANRENFAEIYPGILTGTRNDAAVDRYEDLLFVLRSLDRINAEQRPDWPLLDVQRVAVAGHSSGVLTALHLCGLPVRDLQGQVYAQRQDPRVKAFVIFGYPLEYSGPSRGDLRQVGAIPGLHVVGSEDFPEYRNTSFRYIRGAPQFWLVVTGDHKVGAEGSTTLLQEAVGTFISAYVLNDENARRRFSAADFQDRKGELREFETKRATARWTLDHRDFVAWLRKVLPWGKWLHERSMAHRRTSGKAAE